MAAPIVPFLLLAGLFFATTVAKKKPVVGVLPGAAPPAPVGPIAGVNVELCLDEAATTMAAYFADPSVEVNAATFEEQGFTATAQAIRDPSLRFGIGNVTELTLAGPLRSDLERASGDTLLVLGAQLSDAATDAAGNCTNPMLCFAADCLFAVGSERQLSGRVLEAGQA